MKAAFIFGTYFAMIGFVCYHTDSAWPLLIMLFASPTVGGSPKDEKDE